MKEIVFRLPTILLVLLWAGATVAQTEPADLKNFELDGLKFSYPSTWSLIDRSTAEVQYLMLTKKDSQVLVAIISPRENVPDWEAFSRIENTTKSTYFDAFEKGLTSPGLPLQKESTCLDLNGRKIGGTRFKGTYRNEPAVGELYTLGVGKRLLALAYVRATKDEAAADTAWETIIQSIHLNGTNKDSQLRLVNGGILNGQALTLVKPSYPSGPGTRAGGLVKVLVKIDETGKVFSAKPVSGLTIFYFEAMKAAMQSKFPPALICGQPVQVTGTITYNFVP